MGRINFASRKAQVRMDKQKTDYPARPVASAQPAKPATAKQQTLQAGADQSRHVPPNLGKERKDSAIEQLLLRSAKLL